MPQSLILVVEDDTELRTLLCRMLVREGFRAEGVGCGVELQRALTQRGRDVALIILDLMLPGEDGLSICRRLRASSAIPILILTAKIEDIDRIVGLELGADDYVAKPFNPRELVARIRAILRRAGATSPAPEESKRLGFVGYVLDQGTRLVTAPDGCTVQLTGGEFNVLLAFLGSPRTVLSRDHLLDLTRGRRADPFDRTIDVQIGRLRRKLTDAGTGLITTIRNEGYMFTAPVEEI